MIRKGQKENLKKQIDLERCWDIREWLKNYVNLLLQMLKKIFFAIKQLRPHFIAYFRCPWLHIILIKIPPSYLFLVEWLVSFRFISWTEAMYILTNIFSSSLRKMCDDSDLFKGEIPSVMTSNARAGVTYYTMCIVMIQDNKA